VGLAIPVKTAKSKVNKITFAVAVVVNSLISMRLSWLYGEKVTQDTKQRPPKPASLDFTFT